MLISIIIPVYNERENLLKNLSSLNEQANKFPLEIIVSNSPETTDDSQKICIGFDKVSCYLSNKKGRAEQMNYGASKAKGTVLLFLHADVSLPKDFYLCIKTAIDSGFKAGFFCYKFDDNRFLLRINSSFTKKDGFFAGGGDQCLFFLKETFRKLRGFNTQFCIMEDFELIDKVRKLKIPYTIIQSPVLVSARKYKANSWLRVNSVNGYMFLNYKFGRSPEKLVKIYRKWLK
jgi:rSAM/selenodomain-associated transferase 2